MAARELEKVREKWGDEAVDDFILQMDEAILEMAREKLRKYVREYVRKRIVDGRLVEPAGEPPKPSKPPKPARSEEFSRMVREEVGEDELKELEDWLPERVDSVTTSFLESEEARELIRESVSQRISEKASLS